MTTGRRKAPLATSGRILPVRALGEVLRESDCIRIISYIHVACCHVQRTRTIVRPTEKFYNVTGPNTLSRVLPCIDDLLRVRAAGTLRWKRVWNRLRYT
jgi:hypothetical protein